LLASGTMFCRAFGVLSKYSSFSLAVSSRIGSSFEPEYLKLVFTLLILLTPP
jgi:hypothetical protein